MLLDGLIGHPRRQIAAHARHGQHLEAFLLQRRDDLGIQQRGLARPGLGVKEHLALGQDQRDQVARVAVAPEKVVPVAALIRTGADVGIVLHRRVASHCSRNSAMNCAVLPQKTLMLARSKYLRKKSCTAAASASPTPSSCTATS